MTQHTPGPLYVAYHDEEPSVHICRKFDATVSPMNSETFGSFYGAHIAKISYTDTGCPTKEKAEANARRLAACWNACEVFTTEELEAQTQEQLFDKLQDRIRALTADRDELLAALDAVTAGEHGACRFDRLNPCWDNRPFDVPGKHWGMGDACPACTARAFIAKATQP